MPGVSKGSLEIDLRDGVLTLTGKVEALPEDYRALQREYQLGGYLRKFNISDRIDSAGIAATLKDGVLTLVLPRSEEARPRKIAVQVG
jgi:HSP20 family protein